MQYESDIDLSLQVMKVGVGTSILFDELDGDKFARDTVVRLTDDGERPTPDVVTDLVESVKAPVESIHDGVAPLSEVFGRLAEEGDGAVDGRKVQS